MFKYFGIVTNKIIIYCATIVFSFNFFCRFHIHKSELNIEAGTIYRKYSKAFSDATDNLPIGIPTFCRAFPWHFVIGTCKNSFCFLNNQRIQILDRKLELVQLGSGFMRLFGRLLKTSGTSVSTYFEFNRPRSLTLSFNEIVKRANTPFVLALKQHPDDKFFQANVSRSDTFLTSQTMLRTFFNNVTFFVGFLFQDDPSLSKLLTFPKNLHLFYYWLLWYYQ